MSKILIIEDEAAYLDLLTTQLSAKGYEIVTATNGQEGLDKAKCEQPNLILLDIRMPVMDGVTMLDLLRKDESLKNTKVILLTNLEPNDKLIGDVVRDQPSYYFVKSDTQLADLFEKIKVLLAN